MVGRQSLLLFVVLMCYFAHALDSSCSGQSLLICVAGRSTFCGAFSNFSPPSYPLLSTVYQCDRYLSSHVHGGLWLACQVLPGIGAVSILELQAPRCLTDPTST